LETAWRREEGGRGGGDKKSLLICWEEGEDKKRKGTTSEKKRGAVKGSSNMLIGKSRIGGDSVFGGTYSSSWETEGNETKIIAPKILLGEKFEKKLESTVA